MDKGDLADSETRESQKRRGIGRKTKHNVHTRRGG